MNISFCPVVLSLIQGIALNTDVPPCSQGWGVTTGDAADGPATADDELVYEPDPSNLSTGESSYSSFRLLVGK
jgi:hypothetical protein